MNEEEMICPICGTTMNEINKCVWDCPKCKERLDKWVCLACDKEYITSINNNIKGLGEGIGEDRNYGVCPSCGAKKLMSITYQNFLEEAKNQPIPKINTSSSVSCPYCHSNNTSKIGAVGRLVSVGTLGLAGGKIGKQWHCKNCGSNF